MANGHYQHGVKNFARGNVVWLASGGSNIKAALIDTAEYTVDLANHEFYNPAFGNPPSATTGVEELSGNLTLTDAAVDGVVDASDATFVGTAGDQCEGIMVMRDTGVTTTSPVLFWWDTAGGLPVTLGGDVTVQWNASGIAKI